MRQKKQPKKLTRQKRRGQEGVNFIEKVVLQMNSTWTPTGSLEVGIDGYIELFDRNSGIALGKIIAVQSKVVQSLANEKSDTF